MTRSKVDPSLNLSAYPVQGILARFALTVALVAAVTLLRMGLGVISPTVTPGHKTLPPPIRAARKMRGACLSKVREDRR